MGFNSNYAQCPFSLSHLVLTLFALGLIVVRLISIALLVSFTCDVHLRQHLTISGSQIPLIFTHYTFYLSLTEELIVDSNS